MILRDRREFIRDVALTVPAAMAAFKGTLSGSTLSAQTTSTVTPPKPNVPRVPTWNTELRAIAPDVYAHHHSDHVNGNQYFTPSEIVGHPYCREEVLKMVPGPSNWPKRDGWADGTEPRVILPPVTTFDDRKNGHQYHRPWAWSDRRQARAR